MYSNLGSAVGCVRERSIKVDERQDTLLVTSSTKEKLWPRSEKKKNKDERRRRTQWAV